MRGAFILLWLVCIEAAQAETVKFSGANLTMRGFLIEAARQKNKIAYVEFLDPKPERKFYHGEYEFDKIVREVQIYYYEKYGIRLNRVDRDEVLVLALNDRDRRRVKGQSEQDIPRIKGMVYPDEILAKQKGKKQFFEDSPSIDIEVLGVEAKGINQLRKKKKAPTFKDLIQLPSGLKLPKLKKKAKETQELPFLENPWDVDESAQDDEAHKK